MPAKLKKVTDKYFMYRLTLSCECHPMYRIAPPKVGDVLTCRIHGEATVIEREKVNPSGWAALTW